MISQHRRLPVCNMSSAGLRHLPAMRITFILASAENSVDTLRLRSVDRFCIYLDGKLSSENYAYIRRYLVTFSEHIVHHCLIRGM